ERFGRGIDCGESSADDDHRQAQLHVGERIPLGRAGELQRHQEIRGRAHTVRETVGKIEHRWLACASAQGDVIEAEREGTRSIQSAAETHATEESEALAPLEQQANQLEKVLVPTNGDPILGDSAERSEERRVGKECRTRCETYHTDESTSYDV